MVGSFEGRRATSSERILSYGRWRQLAVHPGLLWAQRQGNAKILAQLYLGRFRASEHASVTSMRVKSRVLKVRWVTYNGCCFERQRYSASIRLRGEEGDSVEPDQRTDNPPLPVIAASGQVSLLWRV